MFNNNYIFGSYFDDLRFFYGEEAAINRYVEQNDKLIIASAQENGTTRLFMRSLNPISDERNKNGWWNTFTITKKPCAEGTYICKIREVRFDKNGYPNFVVTPLVAVDPDLHTVEEVMYVFHLSGMFTESLIDWHYGFNFNNLIKEIEKVDAIPSFEGVSAMTEAAMHAVRLFINGKITKEQIMAWLREPTDDAKRRATFESEVIGFFMSAATNKSQPLLAAKCVQYDEKHGWHPSTYGMVEFIEDLLCKYETATVTGQIEVVDGSIWEQIESYLVFDKARKTANKAAKTAAKKAKKAAAKSKG